MYVNLGIFILRVVLGLSLAGHGSQKLFGWFGGGGWKGWVAANVHMKLRPAPFWALMGGLCEFGGGLLLAFGFLNPLGSLGIIAAMGMAVHHHWPKGYWNINGGYEYPLTLLIAALALAISGPGAWSVDALLGLTLPEPLSLIGGLVLVLAGLLAALYIQNMPAEAPAPVERRGT